MDSSWGEQWVLDFSLGTYSHVLHMLYPDETIYGIVIDGTFIRKKGIDFQRVPVRKTPDDMNVWWWNALHQLDMIDWEFERLTECKEEDGVLMAFPMNTGNCSHWGVCTYHDFCGAWANPLQHCEKPPQGFKLEYWNPLDMEKKAGKVVHLDKNGKEIIDGETNTEDVPTLD